MTIFVTLLLLLAGIFAYTKIDARKKAQGPSEQPSVKGGEIVNCASISPRVDEVLEKVSISRKWYLIDDSVSKQYREILLDIPNTDIPDATTKFFTLKYSVENSDVKGTLEYNSNQKKWLGKVDLATLKADTYTLLVSADIKDCEYENKKEMGFNLSYPVYVTWTLDWEGTDVKNANLDSIATISSKYGIPVTHFFNPYIYHILSTNRQKYLTDWILSRKSMGDSVGLHLHMYSKYVSKAGVTPKNVRWGYNGYGDGYDVPTSEYSYGEFMKILALAYRGVNISTNSAKASIGVGEDPNVNWVDGYGVHIGPLSGYIRGFRSAVVKSGWSVSGLASEIMAGNPSIVYVYNGSSKPYGAYELDPGGYTAYMGMHSEVVIGFTGSVENPTSIITNDPWKGKRKLSVNTFNGLWNYMGRLAVVVY